MAATHELSSAMPTPPILNLSFLSVPSPTRNDEGKGDGST